MKSIIKDQLMVKNLLQNLILTNLGLKILSVI